MVDEQTITLPVGAVRALWRLYDAYWNQVGGHEPCKACQGYGAVIQYDREDDAMLDDACTAIKSWTETIEYALNVAEREAREEAARNEGAQT